LIVRAAVDICQREASAKLDLDLRATRHTVRGDGIRLQQIVWNLVSNAQKFSPPSAPITVRSSEGPGVRVRVEVIDRGVGIDPEVLPKLFTAFEQGNVRASRQQAGLGLGLAISKRLAEAHGGTVTAHSEGRGKGSTFTLELPTVGAPTALAASARPPRGELRASARPRHVLLIEDNEPTLGALTKLLRRLGHRVTTATTVATATAATRHEHFDLIISDLGLPDGSGLDVMRQLRDRYGGRGIALTGYGMESDIAASRDAGFAQHLTKPVDLARLDAAIRAVAD
jgi:CheY-like chemotaxis protein